MIFLSQPFSCCVCDRYCTKGCWSPLVFLCTWGNKKLPLASLLPASEMRERCPSQWAQVEQATASLIIIALILSFSIKESTDGSTDKKVNPAGMDTAGGGHYQLFLGYESRRWMSLCLLPLQSKVGLCLSRPSQRYPGWTLWGRILLSVQKPSNS